MTWTRQLNVLYARPGLSRKRCRERFEQRFQVERMSKNYCKAYELATKQTCGRMP